MALTVFQLVYFASIGAFPVQVRFWYLVLLLVASPEPLQVIYWLPTIGTWAQVIFGYWLMACCVSLIFAPQSHRREL